PPPPHAQTSDFQTVVEANGGTFKAATNGKTDLVVLGSLDREWSKKSPDTWEGSGAEKAITKQRELGGDRKGGPLLTRTFQKFVAEYGLGPDVEPLLCTARFWKAEGNQAKGYKEPGPERSKGSFFSCTLNGPEGPAKGLYSSNVLDANDEPVW
ncbi:hypothetical protein TeGR_g8156, partial [Tetraparma gracilis]